MGFVADAPALVAEGRGDGFCIAVEVGAESVAFGALDDLGGFGCCCGHDGAEGRGVDEAACFVEQEVVEEIRGGHEATRSTKGFAQGGYLEGRLDALLCA